MQETKAVDGWGPSGITTSKGLILKVWLKAQRRSPKTNGAHVDDVRGSEIAEQVIRLLNEWEAPRDSPTKHDFVKKIGCYLNSSRMLQITLWPLCSEKEETPDMLVNDLLAVEVGEGINHEVSWREGKREIAGGSGV